MKQVTLNETEFKDFLKDKEIDLIRLFDTRRLEDIDAWINEAQFLSILKGCLFISRNSDNQLDMLHIVVDKMNQHGITCDGFVDQSPQMRIGSWLLLD